MCHRIPLIVFPIAILAILAAVALFIGGCIAGWDIIGAMTSPTGLLIIFIVVVLILTLLKTLLKPKN